MVSALLDVAPTLPPAVEERLSHELDERDPIFDSIRRDYHGFDKWMVTCKQQQRPAWIIPGEDGRLASVTIIKPEDNGNDLGLPGRVLKICTFKVSEEYTGFKYGELLLKTVLSFAVANKYDWAYVGTFAKHDRLVQLLEEFGFAQRPYDGQPGELRLAKPLRYGPADATALDPLAFNVKYGPAAVNLAGAPLFIVPIRPEFHRLLFPGVGQQQEMFLGRHPFGNAVKKAYLSRSKIRAIPRGSTLLFYRSRDLKGVTALGVVEGVLASADPDEIVAFVGKRTVYSYEKIQEMCRSEVLAILFRHARTYEHPITLTELQDHGIIAAAPQSITRLSVPKESIEWIHTRLSEQYY